MKNFNRHKLSTELNLRNSSVRNTNNDLSFKETQELVLFLQQRENELEQQVKDLKLDNNDKDNQVRHYKELYEDTVKAANSEFVNTQSTADINVWQYTRKANTPYYYTNQFYSICAYEPHITKSSKEQSFSMVHQKNMEKRKNTISKITSDKGSYFIEERIIPSGEPHYIFFNSKVILDQNNSPVILKGTILDVTNVLSSQRVLQKNLQKYKELFEHTPVGIILSDSKGFVFLVTTNLAKYVDNYEMPANVSVVVWQYKAIYRLGNEQTGDFSNTVTATLTRQVSGN